MLKRMSVCIMCMFVYLLIACVVTEYTIDSVDTLPLYL